MVGAMSFPEDGEKKRKTKLEKIAELESRVKILNEENRRLKSNDQRRPPRNSPSSKSTDSFFGVDWSTDDNLSLESSRTSGGSDVEKLKEALKALKRVTVKQEMSLTSLRQKSKQRRYEIEQKDVIIRKLQEENKAFRIAHEKIRGSGSDDISKLKGRIADLELKLAKEETSKEEQNRRLKESQNGISTLQSQLSNLRGRGVSRNTSSSSCSASFMSDGSSAEDVAKLKRDLAKKSEKITNLQFDLEAARDEIHDLKQRYDFNASFPMTPVPVAIDFFDDTDDDDFWGN